ncbi:MAG: hypothetical protein WDN46_14750 [Methylocella sp.]
MKFQRVVDRVDNADASTTTIKPREVPRTQRLLMTATREAIDDAGQDIRPFGFDGPVVRAVADEAIRLRFYERIAEQAGPDEDQNTVKERRRKSFNRSIESALKAQILVAREIQGQRLIWLPHG